VLGFPRNAENLEGWYKVMGAFCTVEFVLFFDCPENVMEARLLQRGQTSGRTDDNPESIRKRFHTYLESTLPIIDRFAKEGKVQRVLATNSVEEVYKDVKRIFTSHPF
jgi:UMP-CMP kinase